jgi:hypothetical protein
MRFKFNKRLRVKIRYLFLKDLKDSLGLNINTDKFVLEFKKEAGLEHTSNRWANDGYYYYFKVIDKQKYLVAKIKYGI